MNEEQPKQVDELSVTTSISSSLIFLAVIMTISITVGVLAWGGLLGVLAGILIGISVSSLDANSSTFCDIKRAHRRKYPVNRSRIKIQENKNERNDH
jgi:uncharacterized membrane protein